MTQSTSINVPLSFNHLLERSEGSSSEVRSFLDWPIRMFAGIANIGGEDEIDNHWKQLAPPYLRLGLS